MKTTKKTEPSIDNFAKKYIDHLEKLSSEIEKDQKDSLNMNLTPMQVARRIQCLDEIRQSLVQVAEEFNEGNYNLSIE